jgi:aldose 1-epimerase
MSAILRAPINWERRVSDAAGWLDRAMQGAHTDHTDHTATRRPYGTLASGESVDRITLTSSRLRVEAVTYGARIVSVSAPDSAGELGEVSLGLADLAAYEKDRSYLGACVGRYANRIDGGRFVLDDHTFEISTNEPADAPVTTLHGGRRGFDAARWEAELGTDAEVRMRRVSPDTEMGFPGDLDVTVTYRVEDADLVVEYVATTTAPTVVNLTNHTYFNLAGGGSVEEHVVRIEADAILPIDGRSIPTGEQLSVEDTPFDLRRGAPIGVGLRAGHEQLVRAHGFDHTYVLGESTSTRSVVRVDEPTTGRSLELCTDRPGVHFYTGNHLDGSVVGRDGTVYRQTDAFCLEPQHFPDSPNRPSFPSTVLRPGEIYRARDVYRFG